jgi:hypothetical protein
MIHNIVISNLYFEGTYAGDNCQGITLVDGYDVKISNCTFTNLGACSIWMTNCVYSEVNNCKSSGSNQPGSGYGVAVADASSFVRVHDNEWDNCRHGFTINAASGFGAVRFVDCYENLVNNSTSYGLDAHSTGTYIVFRNNTVKGFTYSGVETYSAGICSGANFTWIEGNNISGGLRDPSYGISYRGAPQEIYIINNTINNLSGASSHGIYLAGNWFLGGCIINNHINSGVCGMSFYTMNPITRFMIYANDIRTSSYGTRFSYSHGFDVIKNNIYGTLKTLEINGSSNIIYGDYDIPAFD